MQKKIKIIHIIAASKIGGTEIMLCKLLSAYDHAKYDMSVISLLGLSDFSEKIKKLGVPIYCINFKKNFLFNFGLFKLIYHLRKKSPDIVQTWMYNADLIGGIAAKLAGIKLIVWNVRCCVDAHLRIFTKCIASCCTFVSGLIPKVIVCCANSAKSSHVAFGYVKQKMVVIPNGFDLQDFFYDNDVVAQLRMEFGLQDSHFFVGNLGRFAPEKDCSTFLLAAQIVCQKRDDVMFLFAGRGLDNNNDKLKQNLNNLGLVNKVRLFGEINYPKNFLNVLDLFVSSSVTEGFPNVIGEAMACELPCVVTDAGDSADIVGDVGYVVPSRSPEQLAQAILKFIVMVDDQRKLIGKKSRKRVQDLYSLNKVVDQYQNLYSGLLK